MAGEETSISSNTSAGLRPVVCLKSGVTLKEVEDGKLELN